MEKEKDIFEDIAKRKKAILKRQKTLERQERRERTRQKIRDGDIVDYKEERLLAKYNKYHREQSKAAWERKKKECEKKKIEYEKDPENNLLLREYLELASEIKSHIAKFQRPRLERTQRRVSLISSLTNNTFICPSCKTTKTDPAKWVVSKDGTSIICRSCFLSLHTKTPSTKTFTFADVFPEKILRYKVKPSLIQAIRISLRLSVKEFANLAGWPVDSLYKLEEGCFQTVSEQQMQEFIQTCARRDLNVNYWESITYYTINAENLKAARKARCLSLYDLGILMGYSSSYQHKLETKVFKRISEDTAERIKEILILV